MRLLPIATLACIAVAVMAATALTIGPARDAATPTRPTVDTGGAPGDETPSDDWTLLHEETFDVDAPLGQFGTVYGEEWNGYNGLPDTSGVGRYQPDRVLSVDNSILDFHLRTEDGVPLVAAPLPNGYTSTTYGRYSVRFRADEIPGYKIAFLLWPESDVWNDGEIDYPEGNLDGTPMYGASIIVGSQTSGDPDTPFAWTNVEWDASQPHAPTNADDWHTATIEWTPGLIEYFWDGESIGTSTSPSGVPTRPMRWTLQAETNLHGDPVPADSAGLVQVDWVRAWAYTPDADSGGSR